LLIYKIEVLFILINGRFKIYKKGNFKKYIQQLKEWLWNDKSFE
jgi:hypothetical protein